MHLVRATCLQLPASECWLICACRLQIDVCMKPDSKSLSDSHQMLGSPVSGAYSWIPSVHGSAGRPSSAF